MKKLNLCVNDSLHSDIFYLILKISIKHVLCCRGARGTSLIELRDLGLGRA